MGGVDPATGVVTDTHHPLRGQSVAGAVLALPSGRGSCSGSLVIFELLLNGHAPSALVFQRRETILTLGVVIAQELFERGIPIVCLAPDDFAALESASFASVNGETVTLSDTPVDSQTASADLGPLDLDGFTLSERDQAILAGDEGEAARIALRIIVRAAQLENATNLIDVEMAHIDGCFYQGPASLRFAGRLCELGARVHVPATTNAVCVDRRRWRSQGVDDVLGESSEQLADAFVEMGVRPTYTCAPYLLDVVPTFGQQIAWGESNAVVFANSVLGARTLKYPDYLDILVAITGRAPNADCHVLELRRATVHVEVPTPKEPDDAYFALLGYHIGKVSPNNIPVICGLETLSVTQDDLKAFGAAFATTSAVAMFHMLGITPEAATLADALGPVPAERHVAVTHADLEATWHEMTAAPDASVDFVAFGNPHFSLTECETLANQCAGRTKSDSVELMVTCGRDVYEQATEAGHVATINAFGGQFINDACWCFIGEPVIGSGVRSIATNSGKYAHYGPAALPQHFHFASLTRCVTAACTGRIDTASPHGSRPLDLRRQRWANALAAALAPHMPWAPAPGGVEAEQRYTPGIPVKYGSRANSGAEEELGRGGSAADDVAADEVGVVGRHLGRRSHRRADDAVAESWREPFDLGRRSPSWRPPCIRGARARRSTAG